MMKNDLTATARNTILQEADAITKLADQLDDQFEKIVHEIFESKGRVIISGIGKSAIVAQKIVSSLNSTGTPAAFLHAADAIHGDIGMVQENDIVMIISKSGDSPEIKVLSALVKNFNNTLIALCGNMDSYLAKCADYTLNATVKEEACLNNLAPTSSTTAQMVLGDALIVCLMQLRGFGPQDFARFHPGGTLGKKLYLRVSELYINNEKPQVHPDSELKDVIIEITKKRLGITVVSETGNEIAGVITDGDLRRMLEKNTFHTGIRAREIMSQHPKTIESDALAVTALDIMRKNNITQLPVLKNNRYSGIIHLHDLVREGII
jgi:arabinose-5-phosphate isomerase